MFGHNHLFGDLVEIIHANGGLLKKVVQNIAEPLHPKRLTLRERLDILSNPDRNPRTINQFYPVEIETLEKFTPQEDEQYIIGFTGFKMAALCQKLELKFNLKFASLIHPTAIISPTAQISPGAIVNAGTIVASGARLGEHVAVNKGVIIGHDTVLENYAVVQPGVKIGGHVNVGFGSFIGIGAVIIEDLSIGDYSMVAAGAVVIKDVAPKTLVAGVPAVYKKNINQSI